MTLRRTARIGTALLMGTLVAALVLPAGVATAKPPVSVAIEYGNNNCGETVNAVIAGTATVKPTGHALRVTYDVTLLDANVNDDLFVFDGATCSPIGGSLGSFDTDATGAGGISVKNVDVGNASSVYLAARDNTAFPGIFHGSLAVDLS